MEEVKVLVETEIPKKRRPWFAVAHEEINKPLFVTIGPTFTIAGLFKNNYLTGQALQIVKEAHDLEAIGNG